MANYELPQVRVFQDLEPAIEASERAMLPTIIGQRRDLFTYDPVKEEGLIGYYSFGEPEISSFWDKLGANSTVLEDTVRVVGEDIKISLVKGVDGFLDDVAIIPTTHATFDPDLYFTDVNVNQENAFIFLQDDDIAEGVTGLLLAGSALYRAPEVGDYIKVRQTSQDSHQEEDWVSEIIDLIETETSRVDGTGVNTPEEGLANVYNTTDQPETLSVSNVLGGDNPEDLTKRVVYDIVALSSIAASNPSIPWVAKFAETALNRANEIGLFGMDDLGYKIRVSNVDESSGAEELQLEITSKFYNITESIPVTQFVESTEADSVAHVWFNEDGTVKSTGAALTDSDDKFGGFIVDDLFLIYAAPSYTNTIAAAGVNGSVTGTTTLTLTDELLEDKFAVGDYVRVESSESTINGVFQLTAVAPGVAGVGTISYLNQTSATTATSSAIYQVPVKNDQFELAGSLNRPGQDYSGSGTNVPVLTDDSTFDSTVDTTYTIEVVNGGAQDNIHGVSTFNPVLQLKITSNNSLDPVAIITPTINWDTGITEPILIGKRGVAITFAATEVLRTTLVNTGITAVDGTAVPGTTTLTLTEELLAGTLTVGETVTIASDESTINGTFVLTGVTPGIAGAGTISYVNTTTATTAANGTTSLVDAIFDIFALAKADRWTIECEGRSGETIVGVVTAKNFEYLRSNDEKQRLDVEFMQELDDLVEIPKRQAGNYVIENWEIASDPTALELYDIKFNDNAKIWISDLASDLFISTGRIFMVYEAVNNSNNNEVLTILHSSDDRLGEDDPRNPLGYGVRKALLNSRGVPVLAVPMDEVDDDDEMDDILATLSTNNNAYQITPLTFDESIQNKVIAHVLAMSTEIMDRWRVAYISTEVGSEYGLIERDGNNDYVTATFTDSGNGVYNKLILDGSVEDVSFLTEQVRAGQVVRYGYSTGMYGDIEFKEFAVLSVLNQSELLVLGNYGAESSSMRVSIYKDTSANDVISVVGSRSEGLNSRRVINVFPATAVDDNDEAVPGYFVAAALAGLAAGSEPHQGHTNSKLLGFTEASSLAPARRLDIFKLNELAGKGVTIVIGEDSNIGVRHELTTAMIDRKNREAMVTRNLDNISYRYFDGLSPFIGIANVTPEFIDKIKTELDSLANFIIASTRRPLIGSQMISCETNLVEQDAVLSDKINIYLSPVLPFPFNYGDIHLQI